MHREQFFFFFVCKKSTLCDTMLSGWFLLTFALFMTYLERKYWVVFPLDLGKRYSSSSLPCSSGAVTLPTGWGAHKAKDTCLTWSPDSLLLDRISGTQDTRVSASLSWVCFQCLYWPRLQVPIPKDGPHSWGVCP